MSLTYLIHVSDLSDLTYWIHVSDLSDLTYWIHVSDLLDDDGEELLLQTLEGHGEVDDVDLDEDSGQEVGVGHAGGHVQPATHSQHHQPVSGY